MSRASRGRLAAAERCSDRPEPQLQRCKSVVRPRSTIERHIASGRTAVTCSPLTSAVIDSDASQRAADFLDVVALDDVADAHVLVVLEGHAAFLAGLHLRDLVLEALERRELALVHDDIVADEPHMRAALHDAVGDPAARDVADLGDVEDLEDLRVAEHRLAQGRRQHAGQRRLHVIHQIVDDVVVADLDAGLLGEIARLLVGAHVEAEDDRLRGLRQRHVRFGDAADAAMR